MAKTGGLADVSAALPRALAELGFDVQLIMPAYPQALQAAEEKGDAVDLSDKNETVPTRLISARMPDSGLPVWLVDCPTLFDRPGTLYRDSASNDWSDNGQRFARFSRVAARLAVGHLMANWRADVVHANDSHTGLLPLQLEAKCKDRPATVLTIHNLAYQGPVSPCGSAFARRPG